MNVSDVFKYVSEKDIDSEYSAITAELESQVSETCSKGGVLTMPKEYRTIQEVGPLMLVRDVEGVL